MTENPSLHTRGVELYGESLGLLRRALDPSELAKRGMMTFDLEMAAFALAAYEVSIESRKGDVLAQINKSTVLRFFFLLEIAASSMMTPD